MRKYIILQLFIFMVGFAFGQKYTVNYETRSIVLNYPDSVIKVSILNKKDDLKINNDLIYYWYSKDTIGCNRGGINGHPLHGEYLVTSESNLLIAHGNFHQGLKNGVWKRWYKNGELKHIEKWNDGLKHGRQIYYQKNGEKCKVLKYKKGHLHGVSEFYGENETIVKKYRNGEEVIEENKKPFFKNLFRKKTEEPDSTNINEEVPAENN